MKHAAQSLDQMPVVVLGAGRGRRMGGPKSLMPIEGRPWWVWQDERLQSYGLIVHWVISKPVEQAMLRSGTPPLHSAIADETAPMFASVLAGLASIGNLSRGAFLLPVDTPAPRIEHWQLIAQSTAPAHPTFAGKGGHPLFLPGGWIERELAALIAATHHAGEPPKAGRELRLDQLIKGTSRRIPVDDPGVIVNLNHPTDVQSWLEAR